jgi:integrase
MGKRSRKPGYRPYSVGTYRLGWLIDQYCVVWHENGKRFRHRLGVREEEEARTELNAFARAHLRLASEEGDTIKLLYGQYLIDRENDGAPGAVQKAKWLWVSLGPVFGPLRPDDITRKVCRDYAKERKELGRKDRTVHGELSCLRTILGWAQKVRLIKSVPHIWLPKLPEPRDRHLTRDEVDRLLSAAHIPHIRLFIVLALTTAARKQAILDLRWDRVDFERGRIYLHDPDKVRTGKGRAIVPMNDTARAALLEAREGAVSDHVIEWSGVRVANIRRAINTALTRAGLKTAGDGAHLLRHTAAVRMAEAGVPMTEISQYMGHSNSRVTEKVYARFSPDYLQGAASALNLPAVHLQRSAR